MKLFLCLVAMLLVGSCVSNDRLFCSNKSAVAEGETTQVLNVLVGEDKDIMVPEGTITKVQADAFLKFYALTTDKSKLVTHEGEINGIQAKEGEDPSALEAKKKILTDTNGLYHNIGHGESLIQKKCKFEEDTVECYCSSINIIDKFEFSDDVKPLKLHALSVANKKATSEILQDEESSRLDTLQDNDISPENKAKEMQTAVLKQGQDPVREQVIPANNLQLQTTGQGSPQRIEDLLKKKAKRNLKIKEKLADVSEIVHSNIVSNMLPNNKLDQYQTINYPARKLMNIRKRIQYKTDMPLQAKASIRNVHVISNNNHISPLI